MYKKVLAAIVAVAMLFTSVPVTAKAAGKESCNAEINYVLEETGESTEGISDDGSKTGTETVEETENSSEETVVSEAETELEMEETSESEVESETETKLENGTEVETEMESEIETENKTAVEEEAEVEKEVVNETENAFFSMDIVNDATSENDGAALTEDDFLKANGKNLRNQSGEGEIVQLKGTNAGGYLIQEFWMTPTESTTNVNDQFEIMSKLEERFGKDAMYEILDIYENSYWTEQDFDNCAAMGINTIRLPFWYRNLVDENGNFYGYDASAEDPYAEAFELMDWFIAEAKERGIYVVVDFHGAPGSQNGSDHSGVDGEDAKERASQFFFGDNAAANQKLYYEIWEVVANRYKDEPAVAAYDLLNEPYCTYRYSSELTESADELHQILWTIYDNAYDKIRAIDQNHVIIMEATWDPIDLPNPVEYGWSNVMYEYHNYLYDDYDNANGGQISSMQSKLTAIAIADYNVPSYMGEFSFFNSYDAWDEGLQLLTDAGINWTTWTYKTVETYGNWGLYHHVPEFNTGINLETASLDEIKAWYARMNEQETNTNLVNVVSKYAEKEAVANSMLPEYVEIEDGSYYLMAMETENIVKVGDGVAAATIEKDTTTNSHMFVIENHDDDTISLKSAATGKYLSVGTDNQLTATAEEITDAEKFYPIKLSVTTLALKSKSAQLFVSCKEENNYVLEATASAGQSTESFYLVNSDDEILGADSIALHSGWTRMEAENATIHQAEGAEAETPSIDEQTFYSEGKAITGMKSSVAFEDIAADFSNVNYAEFMVEAPKAGEYQMVMSYNGDDDKVIAVKVNDNVPEKVTIPVKSGHAWDAYLQHVVTVTLKEGTNTIKITGTLNNSAWMNLDCIDVCNNPINDTDSSIRLEGENFYHTGAIENQSFYSNGSGVGNLNNDITLDKILPSWNNVKHVEFTIYSEEAADYTIKWAYNGNGADGMKALYRLNHGEAQVLTLNNSGAAWNKMNSITFDVSLEPGFNTLQISGTIENKDNWANVDYIELVSPGAAEARSGFDVFEAEKAAIYGNATLETNDIYSCKKGVGSLTNRLTIEEVSSDWSGLNYITYTVDVPQTGTYRAVVHYNGDDDKEILVKVNNGEQHVVSVPAVESDHSPYKMHTFELELELAAGTNSISLSGAMADIGWINYDYIELAKNEIKVVDEEKGTVRYEAEDFSFKSTKTDAEAIEAQDFYSDGYCVGGVGGAVTYVDGMDILASEASWINFTVYAQKAGNYNFTLAMNGNGVDINAAYQMNGEASHPFVLKNAGHAWNEMGYGTFEAELKKGYNEVIISGGLSETMDDWANYDYLDVTYDNKEDDVSGNNPEEGEDVSGNNPNESKDGFWVEEITDVTYTGKALKPDVTVYDGEKLLKQGTDYKVSYKNNIKVGSATVTVEGKGNYSGKDTVTFNIVPKNMNEDDVIVNYTAEFIETGKKQKPLGKITYNGITLKAADYKVEYFLIDEEGNKENTAQVKKAGNYKMVITGKHNKEKNTGNFSGSVEKDIKVFSKDGNTYLKNMVITIEGKKTYSTKYTGKEIKPEVTVTPKGTKKTPVSTESYTVSYENNVDIGTASITITGKSEMGLIGTVKKTFKITGTKLSDVAKIDDKATLDGKLIWQKTVPYDVITGQAVQPVDVNGKNLVKLTYKGSKNKDLTFDEGVHYKVSYLKNDKPGTATMVFTGIGKYTGTIKKTFKVGKIDLSKAGEKLVVTHDTEAIYAKKGSKINVALTYDGVMLVEGKDYKVSYGNNKAVTTEKTKENKKPIANITGIGTFSGKISKKFVIKAANLETDVKITAADTAYQNKKGKYKVVPVLTDANGTKLANNKDFTCAYYLVEGEELKPLTNADVVDAFTTVRVVATAKGSNFTGSTSADYEIKVQDIAKAKVTVKAQVYTGKEIKITAEDFSNIKVGDTTLKEGTHYVILDNSYKNNINKGTASVTIEGIGNYGGTKTVTFKITSRTIAWWWNLIH